MLTGQTKSCYTCVIEKSSGEVKREYEQNRGMAVPKTQSKIVLRISES